MKVNKRVGVRHFSLASAAVLAVGLGASGTLGAAGTAGAAPSAGPSKGTGQFATAVVANDTLTITGTNGPDNISFALNGSDPNTLDVDLDNNGLPGCSVRSQHVQRHRGLPPRWRRPIRGDRYLPRRGVDRRRR